MDIRRFHLSACVKKSKNSRRHTMFEHPKTKPSRKSYGGALGFEQFRKEILEFNVQSSKFPPPSIDENSQTGSLISPNEHLVETNNDCDTTSFYSVNDTYAMPTANDTDKILEVYDQTFETKPLSGETFSEKNMAKLELENARLKAEIQRLSSMEQLSINFPSENSSDTGRKSSGLENDQTTMVSDRRVNKIRRKECQITGHAGTLILAPP